MQSAPIGQKVHSIGINPVTVADNCKGRVVLIDPNPQYKHIAWDESIKRKVEVNQDICLKYGLSPQLRFYYLVARLNTDMAGNVVNDQFVIEYLQLSENVNNEFADTLAENPNFSHILIQKVTKKGQEKDFSYIKPIPSGQPLPQSLMDKIVEIRGNIQGVAALWQLIDRATSLSMDQYIQLKTQAGPVLPPPTPTAQIAPGSIAPQSAPMPSSPGSEDNGFGVGGDFDSF